VSDTASFTKQRTSTPLAMTWLVRRRCSDIPCCHRPSYLTRRQHTAVWETHAWPTWDTPQQHRRLLLCGTRREGAAIDSTVAQQPL